MTVRVLQGHVLDVLAGLPAKSVHVAVTSPPYWNLRNYSTEPQVWGAAEGCECEWGDPITDKKRGQDAGATARVNNTQKRACPPETQQGCYCVRCGAWRGELGSEPTLDLFVAHLVEVFEGVKRVLRDDGTLWINLGDTFFSGSNGSQERPGSAGRSAFPSPVARRRAAGSDTGYTAPGGSHPAGSSSSGLCDACAGALAPHIADTPPPPNVSAHVDGGTDPHTSPQVHPVPGGVGGPPLGAPVSTTPQSSPPPPAEWTAGGRCASCGASLSGSPASPPDALASAHTTAYSDDIETPSGTWVDHTSGTASSELAYQYYPTKSLKAGDLCMAPARFALAMQAAGWTLRSQIVLPKTAPMPESVQSARWERCRVRVAPSRRAETPRNGGAPDGVRGAHGAQKHIPGVPGMPFDSQAEWADCPGCDKCRENDGLVQRWGSWRPTSAYEVLYLFSKAGQRYYADGEAVRVPNTPGTIDRLKSGPVHGTGTNEKARISRGDGRLNDYTTPSGRNLWNYVMWKPEPSSLQHYAAYPRWLPRLAIQAGTSERGCCPGCGAPWLRVVERSVTGERHVSPKDANPDRKDGLGEVTGHLHTQYFDIRSTTLGWRQSCACPPHAPAPATVLDCFGGSGTTGIEANALGRHAVLVELQEKYVDIAHKRLSGQPVSLFAHDGAAEFEGGADVEGPDTTKQERHPNRTVAGFNRRWKAKHGAVGVAPEAAG